MSNLKKFINGLKEIESLSTLPEKQFFLDFMEYVYDKGYGNKIVELFNNYLTGEN